MASGPLLEAVHKGKEENPEECVGDRCTEFVRPAPMKIKPDHAARDQEVQNFVDHVESRGDQQARADAFDVELDSKRRSPVADDRLRNAIDAEKVIRTSERVLKESDAGPS